MGGRACWGRGLLGRGLLGRGGSATDLYRGLQSLLEHARFPSANTLLPCGGTRLGALDHWERARGTPAGRSPWVWESTEVLAAPQPGLAFWSCALRSQKRSRREFPRQGALLKRLPSGRGTYLALKGRGGGGEGSGRHLHEPRAPSGAGAARAQAAPPASCRGGQLPASIATPPRWSWGPGSRGSLLTRQ